MFNPFEPFRGEFIDAFRKAGKTYLVSQTYSRGKDPLFNPDKTPLLFSHYDNLSHANIHLSALKGDKFAAIIDLENEVHRERILEMLRHDSNYIIFSSLVKSKDEVEKMMNRKYEANIRRYVTKNTNWRIGSDKTIYPQLDMAFGQLFLILKYGSQQIRFALDELEKT